MQGLLISAISIFFRLFYILIFIRIVLSWLPLGQNPLTQMIYGLTEPILGPIRELIHKSPLGGGMMLDFSPVIALFMMELVRDILIGLIRLL